MEEYAKVHLLSDKTIRVHHQTREVDDERDYDAVVQGVYPDGRLQVRNPVNGAVELLSGQEVSIRITGSL